MNKIKTMTNNQDKTKQGAASLPWNMLQWQAKGALDLDWLRVPLPQWPVELPGCYFVWGHI